MTHPELTLTDTDDGAQILWEATETHRTHVGKLRERSIATRLVACWNACREMDDPVAEIAELSQRNVDQRDSLTRLREYIDQREKEHALLREGNQSLLQKLSELEGKPTPADTLTESQQLVARLTLMIDNNREQHDLVVSDMEDRLRKANTEIDRLNNLVAERDRTIARMGVDAIVVGHGISTSSMLDASDHRPDSSPSLTEHATRLRHFLRAAYSLILSGDDANKEILLERIESAMVNCSLILSSAK